MSRPPPVLLWLVMLPWLAACATDAALDSTSSAPASTRPTEARLEALLASPSPADFLQAQRGLDMARLVDGLEDWSAVRLGARGPLPAPAAERLNLKRASFLVSCVREDGPALAEVFALFVLHSTCDEDLRQVLRVLAQDKRLEQTLGRMPVVAEQLRRRGLPLSDFADRPEHAGADALRGARAGLAEVVSSVPLLQWGVAGGYDARKRQLPAPYQEALTRVEAALVGQALAPGAVAHGVLDELSFGVPLGAYALAAATGQGVTALSRGEYEQATRELTPAALMVALYAGGKSPRAPRLQTLASTLRELQETARRLRARLGEQGLETLSRSLQADPGAALLLAETGEAGALALQESGGSVPRARAWLSQAQGAPADVPTPGVGRTALEAEGALPGEVVDAKVVEGELDFTGPRLSPDVAALRGQLAAVRRAPPSGSTGHVLWSEYLRYTEGRLGLLERGTTVERGRAVEPPLRWEGYQRMRGLVTRGFAFERVMTEALRAEAALPRAARRFLGDFEQPRIERYVGVWKPGSGLRFVDVLVLEERPLAGQPPRVETFSFKSRDLSGLRGRALEAQLIADVREALRKYGETLDIRRGSLQSLFPVNREVQISRVRLVYEGGHLRPTDMREWKSALDAIQDDFPEVEVLFQ